ncbi:MAG: GFA family protein [Pseudobacteriovorax sp.]|nr:GFA family protein [Pseudobacteriovorax sp.]
MYRGSCLCEAVRFEFSDYIDGLSLCYCSVCRKISGSAFAATLIVPKEKFKWISGRDLLKTYEKPTGLSLSFCSKCGSQTPDAEPAGKVYPIPAGILEGDLDLPLVRHIYTGSKADWCIVVDNGAPQFTEDG